MWYNNGIRERQFRRSRYIEMREARKVKRKWKSGHWQIGLTDDSGRGTMSENGNEKGDMSKILFLEKRCSTEPWNTHKWVKSKTSEENKPKIIKNIQFGESTKNHNTVGVADDAVCDCCDDYLYNEIQPYIQGDRRTGRTRLLYKEVDHLTTQHTTQTATKQKGIKGKACQWNRRKTSPLTAGLPIV
jgi:hypothetical protein